MEAQAMLWAAQRITDGQMQTLREIEKEMATLCQADNHRRMVELEFLSHQIINRAARNRQMADILDRITCHFLRFWLSIPRELKHQSLLDGLRETIEAIEAKDDQRLVDISRTHTLVSVKEIMSYFLESPPDGASAGIHRPWSINWTGEDQKNQPARLGGRHV
jgi:DNA-binding GntR family transcriptional regulator